MRLVDLDPHWYTVGAWASPDRQFSIGLTFLCPCCRAIRLAVPFDPPVDPTNMRAEILYPRHPQSVDRHIWTRTGETFDTLTLSPSVDASAEGHWHGFITNGAIA